MLFTCTTLGKLIPKAVKENRFSTYGLRMFPFPESQKNLIQTIITFFFKSQSSMIRF